MRWYFALAACIIAAAFTESPAQGLDWRTDFEKSGGKSSPDFAATMSYARRLEKASPWIRVTDFGTTPQGRRLPLIIVSKDRVFTPDRARASGKPVVLVQSGIHAGEIDGKDASLMLLREIAVTKSLAHLADGVTLLIMPIFNLDGHERRSPTNRINQNGPDIQGWRTTAQNLNLNRDYIKADAPEMRAWLRCYNVWQPELLIDCHVTDGIDFQYNLTYSMELFENCPPSVVAWQKGLREAFVRGMAALGDPVCPYVFPREDLDLSKGLLNYAAPPRFSAGYAAVRNRAAVLVETHMLKPYATRVTSTYRLLVEILGHIHADPSALRRAVDEADRETIRLFSSPRDSAWFPVDFQQTEFTRPIDFLGYQSAIRTSDISGGTYVQWDRNAPMKVTVPFFDEVTPTRRVRTPRAYMIPQEWSDVIVVLQAHGLHMTRLSREQRLPVAGTVFSKPKWREQPYEGRHTVRATSSTRLDTVTYPAGTWIVRLDQPGARVAVHLLEPDAPDSFLGWGFFNTIFEQKEYFESYVMEGVARDMLAADSALRTEFLAKVASDSLFAKNPRARLNFFYERSPWYDSKLNVYPVGKVFDPSALKGIEDPVRRR